MKGFTLLELLLVLAIFSLSIFVFPKVSRLYKSMELESYARKAESLFKFASFFSLSSGERLLVEIFPRCNKIILKTEPKRQVKLPKGLFCKVNGQILDRKLTLFISPYGVPIPVVISFLSNDTSRAYKLWFPPPSFFPKLEKTHKTLEIN